LELERVLTKLKFDESVTGYALITNDGQPFLSFSLPDEVLPQVKGTLKIHASDLKLVNIMTSQGSVILSRVDPQWVLAVLFVPDLPLGSALSRAKSVVELLEEVTLPPPPVPLETEDEISIEVTATEVSEPPSIPLEVVPPPSHTEEPAAISKDIELTPSCIVHRSERYTEAMILDSFLNNALKKTFANLGVDVLLIIDEKMTVSRIAGNLSKPIERVLEIIQWCLDQNVVNIEYSEEQDTSRKEIIEIPVFDGKIDKVKEEDQPILQLCDGTRTLQEIAAELGMQYFQALQSILPYRGKTLRMVRTDKETGV
jgi:predicted regulator of Ras-like GTPase activity (Roadblock/LC7/MglB family)